MECEFCEYNMAQCEVRHATISQVACGSCANKLDSTWAVHHEFDVSPWDFAGQQSGDKLSTSWGRSQRKIVASLRRLLFLP